MHINTHLFSHFPFKNQSSCERWRREISIPLFFNFLLVGLLRSSEVEASSPSGTIRGKTPPPGQCNTGDQSECCKNAETYPIFRCLPPMTSHTGVHLTLNSFEKGGDSGSNSEFDKQYHSNDIPVVALSTRWFNHKSRCLRNITIYGNGNNAAAMVVDECNSTEGRNKDHDYQPPCDNDIVDVRAVWKALGVPKDNLGWLDITWTDA